MNYPSRHSLLAAVVALCVPGAVLTANPIDPNPAVVSGQVAFEGLHTNEASILQQSQQAIVDYTHFNIVEGGSVTFVQPSADASILNRITGADPSTINGSILANGQVYFVNPAGVTFGPNSVVRADMFMAIAGDMTNTDFLNGSMRFDLTGTVDNQGLIDTQRGVALLGRQVKNTGEIVARDGFAVLASGNEVLLQPKGTSLAVQISGSAGDMPEDGVGVDNLGTVDGEEIMFSAGDAFATAVRHSGKARAGKSAKVHSDGGRIEVSGGIKARDESGGGRIEVGGTDQGGPGAPTAAETTIAAGAILDASAGTSGDGGHVVVWSDGMTEMFGAIDATGSESGSGGFAEVSGHYVDFGPGGWNVMLGSGGEFLIDPFDYLIGGTEADAIRDLLSAGTSVTIDTAVDNAGQGSSGNPGGLGNITLAAPVIVSNDTNEATLTLDAANDIIINSQFVSNQPNAAGTPVLVLDAGNNITLNAGLTARSTAPPSRGSIILTAGGDIAIDANVDAGGGNILISSTAGDVTLGTDKILTAGGGAQPSLIEILADTGTVTLGGVIELFADSNVYIKTKQFRNLKGSDLIGGVAPGSWTIALPHPIGRDKDSRMDDQHQYGALASGNPAQYGEDGGEFGSSGMGIPARNTYYFYDYVPVIDITVDPKAKTYGNDVTNLGPYVADVDDLVNASVFPYGGVFTQDTLASAISGTATFISAGEAPTAAVADYDINISGLTSPNGYAFNYVPGTLTVNARAITLTASRQSKIYGDTMTLDTTAFTVLDLDMDATLPNGESITNVDLSSLNMAETDTTLNAATYGMDLSINPDPATLVGDGGFVPSNYAITREPGDLVVIPRDITVLVDPQDKFYGDQKALSNTAFTVRDKGVVGDATLPNGDAISTVDVRSKTGKDSSTISDVDTYVDELESTGLGGVTGLDLGNYNLTFVDGNFEITPRPVTLTADDQTKDYGDELPLGTTAFTITDKGLTPPANPFVLPNGETIDAVALNSVNGIDVSTVTPVGANAAEIEITGQTGGNGFKAGNYDLTYVRGSLEVMPRAVTLTANRQEKTYGDSFFLDDTAFTVLDKDGDGVLPNGETVDTVTVASLGGHDASTTSSAGLYVDDLEITDQVGANGFLVSNYDLTYVKGDLEINRREVVLTAGGQNKIYGDPLTLDNTAFTIRDQDGDASLPNGEMIDTVNLVSATGADASTTTDAGVYADEIEITGQTGSGGFDANNYDLSYVAGDLEVLARTLTLTATRQEKTYGDALILDNTAFTVLDKDGDADLPNGETVDTVDLVSAGGVDTSTTAAAGTYVDNIGITGQAGSGGFDAGNYAITHVNGDLAVNRRAVTVAAGRQEKTYGDPLSLDNTAFTVLDKDGDAILPNGETIDTVDLLSAAGIDASTTAGVGTYADNIGITGQAGSNGFDAGNYDLSYINGDLVVNQRALTLTALQQEREYGTAMILDPGVFTVLDQDGDAALPNGEMVDALTLVSTDGLAGDRAAFPDFYPGNIVPVGQTGAAGFLASNYDITYVAGDLLITGFPPGTVLMAEGAFEDYADLFLNMDVEEPFGLSDPASRSAPLSIFGFPEWARLGMSERLWVLAMIDQAADEKLTEEYLLHLIEQSRNAN